MNLIIILAIFAVFSAISAKESAHKSKIPTKKVFSTIFCTGEIILKTLFMLFI